MKTRTSWILSSVLAIAVPVWADCGFCGKGGKEKPGSHSHAHAEVGKPAPDFALKDISGKEHKLSALKGKVVVLEWANIQCPVVNRCHNRGIMKGVSAKFQDKPVAWLAVDSSHFCEDMLSGIRAWVKKSGVEYPYLLDAAGTVGHAYGAKTTPHMFVIDQKGVLAYAGAIDNDPYGDKEGKRNFVEEAVTALLNGSTVATTETKPYGCSVKYKK